METKKKLSLMVALILILQIILPTFSLITNKVIAAGGDLVTLTFKDENLFNALKEVLGDKVSESSGPNTEGNYIIKMTQANIDSITSLGLDSKQISNIEGIEAFTNLQRLSFGFNQITKIDSLSNLTNLTYLNLHDNKITNVDSLLNLTNLTELYIQNNNITNINSLSNLTKLTRLYAWGNAIENIDILSNFTKLYDLRVEVNKIADINLISNLTKLNSLKFSGKQIININALSNLTNLTYLNLDGDIIENLDSLSNLTNLTQLELWENQIETIDCLSNLTNLTELDLYKNQITNIDCLSNLTNLTSLGIRNNNIKNIDSLSNLTSLTTLYLYNNQIANIDSLSNLVNLEKLYIQSNNIEDISVIKNFNNLKLLNASGNNISSIGNGLDDDEFPIMGDNGVVLLNGFFPETLEELNLNDNKINDIYNLSNLKNLKKLELQNNRIEDISPIENLNNITSLKLENQTIVKQANKDLNNMELPNIFKSAQQETSKVYSTDGVFTSKGEITQSKLNYDKNNIGLIGVGISGGAAKGTTLYVVDSEERTEEILNGEIKIYNKDDLIVIQKVNNVAKADLTGKTISMQNDIDLGNEEWTPIGTLENLFKGTFDGNGHKITGLYINSTQAFQGLVGINSGTISNLSVKGNAKSTEKILGGICGNNRGNITNCYSDVTIEGNTYVGGIAGFNSGKIENCYNIGNISGTENVGGISGENAAGHTIKYSYSIGTVTGSEKVGAIVGENYGQVTNSYYLNTSAVKAINNEDDEANNVKGMSAEEMKSAAFVTTLNEGQESGSWKAGDSSYEYPRLSWEQGKELTEIEITQAPTKVAYIEGENFDPSGMKVVAKYSDGTSQEVTNYTITGGNNLQTGTKKVTIKYKEGDITKTVNQNITVVAKALTSIKVTKAPTKISYKEGECFDRSGMEVTAYYSNGTSKVVTNYLIPDESNLTPDKVTVTISYKEDGVTKEVTQKISVVHDFEEIVKEATCTEGGYIKHKCKVCGLEVIKSETEALGHDYKETVTKPTCTEGGYTTHTCTRCGDTYVDSKTEAQGHNYENGVCTRCGGKEPNIQVSSEEYVIDEVHNYIKDVGPKTTVEEIKAALTTNATEVKLYKNGKELNNSDQVGTNTEVYLKNAYGEITLTIIVTGDADGDGDANFWDMLAINKHRLGINVLEGALELAGDVTEDGVTDFWDMLEINKFRLGLINSL